MARPKKYVPKHQLTKGLPLILAELGDSAIDHFGRFMDNVNARDIVYLLSFASAVYLAYKAITLVSIPFNIFLNSLLLSVLTPSTYAPPQTSPPSAQQLDMNALALSFVVAYEVLKLDLGDVASAVSKISASITSLSAIAVA